MCQLIVLKFHLSGRVYLTNSISVRVVKKGYKSPVIHIWAVFGTLYTVQGCSEAGPFKHLSNYVFCSL